MRRFVVINGVIPILLGVIIYYLIAPETIFSKTIDGVLKLNIHIEKEYMDGCVFRFIRCYGLDMIWGYSFTIFVSIVVKNLNITFIIAALFSVLIETLQLCVLPGVFDPLDILFQVVAVVCAIIMIRRQSNEKHDKKTC